ncbi:MAG TPA: anthranilate synthase component I [Caulobacteraceae bacterium]|jgi:anthranilate synthase component 1|nr:anthranilate synthase component I [Caulobacteraceae bacterium]
MTLEPAFDAFEPAFAAGAPQFVWRRIIDDLETPVSAYLKIGHGRPYAFLFESVEGGAWRGRYSIITLDPDIVWRCRGEAAEAATLAGGLDVFTPQPTASLESLKDLVARSRVEIPAGLPPMVGGLFGVVGYDMIRLAEPLGEPNPDPLGLPDAILTRPSTVAVFDSIGQEIILASAVRPDGRSSAREAYAAADERLAAVAESLRAPAPRRSPSAADPAAGAFASPIDRPAYGAIVERAKAYIRAGDVFQVVPSHRFSMPFARDPFTLYRSLRRTNPSPFLFFLNFPDFALVGSSPEILVRLRDRKITIRPIAGTRRRGATPQEDLALEAELLADQKERAEHLMLLDLGRNDVGRVAMLRDEGANSPAVEGPQAPRVRVTESFKIERYSHVMHIVSNVEGDAPEGLDPVDVLMAALPAGTLSGAPKVRAMQIIDELETVKRGVAYAGAVGYFGADGAVDTCIVLRTALVKDGVMHVQAGGGVVFDSDPDAEYEETLMKSAALKRAAEEAWRFG